LLTAIRLPPGGRSTVHIYTQTVHRTTQCKQYIEQHKNFGRMQTVPRLGELYPGICLTTEEKARKNLLILLYTMISITINMPSLYKYKIQQWRCVLILSRYFTRTQFTVSWTLAGVLVEIWQRK